MFAAAQLDCFRLFKGELNRAEDSLFPVRTITERLVVREAAGAPPVGVRLQFQCNR